MPRVYEKGEKRHKHETANPQPTIAFDPHNPKKWVGKCPVGMAEDLRTRLLNEAIPAPIGDREIDFPKRLYVVHDGAIYEARTSNHGISYHGFPYRGKLRASLVDALRVMATTKGCLAAFEVWLKTNVIIQGR
jgi:hypothetical protein